MTLQRLIDYVEANLDVNELTQQLLILLSNSFEREKILEACESLNRHTEDVVGALAMSEELESDLLFYHQQREEAYKRVGRIKRIFSFSTSEAEVEEEAFQKALRDTQQMRSTLHSQDPNINSVIQSRTELTLELKDLLLRLIDQSEEGRELSKELLEQLFSQIFGQEAS